MPRHSLRFVFRIDVIEWLKPFHFAGDPTLEGARVETRDWSHPAAAGDERIPKGLQSNPIGREYAHSGHDDTITL